MTTHRRYYFVHEGSWEQDGGHTKVRDLLVFQSEKRWWYNEPVVEGEPFGRLTFAFTVSGEDQWRCHRRAMALAMACYRKLGLTTRDIPEPLWEPLDWVSNRSRFRLPIPPPVREENLTDLFEQIVNRNPRP